MSAETLSKTAAANPRTAEDARTFVKHVESLFTPWNVAAIVDGFTDDCVVRFGTHPEIHGRTELEKFFRARSARQLGYRLRKEFRALCGDIIANSWNGEWEDAQTGGKMTGFGVEIWVMRGGKIAVWDAAFNITEGGKVSGVGIT